MMQQIDDDSGDVLRSQLPTLFVAGRVAAEFCVHQTGHDVTDFDAVMPNFLHQGFAETVEAEFRGVISGHARMWIRAGERRDVDDIATAAPSHFRYRFMTTIEHAEEICFQHGTKIFG